MKKTAWKRFKAKRIILKLDPFNEIKLYRYPNVFMKAGNTDGVKGRYAIIARQLL